MRKDHGKEVEFQTNSYKYGYIICFQWSPEKDAPGFLKPGNSGGKSNRTEEQGIMKTTTTSTDFDPLAAGHVFAP